MPPGWEYGVPVSYVRERVERWHDVFDWWEQQHHVDVINVEGGFAWGVADLQVSADLSKIGTSQGQVAAG